MNHTAPSIPFGPVRELERKEILYLPGSEPGAVYALVGGRITLSRILPDGREFDIPVTAAGCLFGDLEVILGIPRRLQAIAGGSGATIRQMERRVFMTAIETAPARERLLLDLATKSMQMMELAADLAHLPAIDRVKRSLGRLSGDGGRFQTTHEAIAKMSGISRETATRALCRLDDLGIIGREGQRITILKPDMLQALS